MAEVDKWHYNSSSGSDTVKLPVQIHMSNDSDFVSKILENDLDLDDSIASDLNCSAVVESFNSEHTSDKHNVQSTSGTSSTLVKGSSFSDVATQQTINVQILAQLSSISDILNVLEKKDVKKDSKRKKGVSKKKSSAQVVPVTLPPTQCPCS